MLQVCLCGKSAGQFDIHRHRWPSGVLTSAGTVRTRSDPEDIALLKLSDQRRSFRWSTCLRNRMTLESGRQLQHAKDDPANEEGFGAKSMCFKMTVRRVVA